MQDRRTTFDDLCAEELFLIKMINTNTCNFVSGDEG